jgi:hypothetical protein
MNKKVDGQRKWKTKQKHKAEYKKKDSKEKVEAKRERKRQNLRTEWAEGKSAGYCLSAIEKRKKNADEKYRSQNVP